MRVPLVALLWCGPLLCGPVLAQSIDVEFDHAADFTPYKTYRLLDGDIDAKSPALNNAIVRKNLESEIRARLKEKGFTEVEPGVQPDLNVRFHLGSARRSETTAIPAGRAGGVRKVRSQTTEGTLTIDFLVKRDLVWRAIATDDDRDPTKIAGRLDDMVKKAIGKFPPKK
ncbi:MAG: DUF4136 domain-containing protein [Acidobacteriota bacterium]